MVPQHFANIQTMACGHGSGNGLPGPISTNINATMCSPEAISEEILKSILDTNLKIIALLL